MPRGLYNTHDEAQWRQEFPAERSVFGSVEFAQLAERHCSITARLFVMGIGIDRITYPFYLRPINGLPFDCSGKHCDTVTPEYSGPFGIKSSSAGEFSQLVHESFRDLGVIAEFMHLNPWQVDAALLQDGETSFNREVVWVDVSLSHDNLWTNHFTHACRKNIKRSQSEKLRIFEASCVGDIREFNRIYCDTMDRNQALSSYYFPLEYFVSIFENFGAHSRFVLAEQKGTVIAATLYLHDRENVFSYLGGADYGFQHTRPSNAIVYDTIDWARRLGKKRLVLGGGYRPDDGIFKFKSSFSNLRTPFYVHRRIHLPDQYRDLEEKWCEHFNSTVDRAAYFPSYRSVSPMKEEDELVCDASR